MLTFIRPTSISGGSGIKNRQYGISLNFPVLSMEGVFKRLLLELSLDGLSLRFSICGDSRLIRFGSPCGTRFAFKVVVNR